uniref:T-kininogen 1-like n=1 Tax=Pogona vitticeps TaxID=103695 RepID=A0A6J0V005_9SAUR
MELLILLLLSLSGSQAVPLQGEAVGCDDPEVFHAVDLSLKAFNRDLFSHGNLFALNVILETNKTAGPGKTFFVKYSVRETACANRSIPWQNCKFLPPSEGARGKCEIHIDDTTNSTNILGMGCGLVPPPLCVGCPESIPTDSKEVYEQLHAAMERFNRESDEAFYYKAVRVTKATSQVVDGVINRITFSIKKTNCSKAEFDKPNRYCTAIQKSDKGTCTVKVHMDNRKKHHHTDQHCKLPVKLCVGCHKSIRTDSEDVEKVLEATMKKYNSESNDAFHYKVASVTEATAQIVSGVNYQMEFIIKKTNCSKAKFDKPEDSCIAAEEINDYICTVKAYVDLTNTLVDADLKCRPAVCPGCPIPIQTDSEEVKDLLDAAMREYNSEIDENFYYKVDHIIKATSQVVNGVIYRITFIIKKCVTPKFHTLRNICLATHESAQFSAKCVLVAFKEAGMDKFDTQMICADERHEKAMFLGRPPGFTPFRLARMNEEVPATESEHETGVPHLPEPKCPGKPWEPIVTPDVSIEEPDDLGYKYFLPFPGEESTAGSHEIAPTVAL